jgi:hypothetical protein
MSEPTLLFLRALQCLPVELQQAVFRVVRQQVLVATLRDDCWRVEAGEVFLAVLLKNWKNWKVKYFKSATVLNCASLEVLLVSVDTVQRVNLFRMTRFQFDTFEHTRFGWKKVCETLTWPPARR